jgi:sarcosine oxidase subunit gamma
VTLALCAEYPLAARAALAADGVGLRAVPPKSIMRLQIAVAPAFALAIGDAPPVLGTIELPLAPNHTGGSDPLALWMSPDSWLLVSEHRPLEDLLSELEPLARWRRYVAADASHSLERLVLEGPLAREILAAGCGLDLDPRRFPVGRCARTRFAHLALLVSPVAAESFHLFVDRSLADWLWDWIADAAGGLGPRPPTSL